MKVFVFFCLVGAALAFKGTEKSCEGNPESGMCLAYIPSYYYDASTDTCKRFIYGGCQGNGNRYSSEEECLEHCSGYIQSSDVAACSLLPDSGPCKAFIPRYYFDSSSGQCEEFIYGGCKGNQNNFKTKDECHDTCSASESVQHVQVSACSLEPETGFCKARIPRYYFDSSSGECKQFIYGGCGGNENNFRTKEKCHSVCSESVQQSEVAACSLEPETGPCRAYFIRYYFDSSSGECKDFIYGGCQGNENNFRTKEECHGTCSATQAALDRPDCDKAPESGLCRGAFPRYYYDQEAGMCKTFVYGGCGGNRNNFETEFDCYNKCGAL